MWFSVNELKICKVNFPVINNQVAEYKLASNKFRNVIEFHSLYNLIEKFSDVSGIDINVNIIVNISKFEKLLFSGLTEIVLTAVVDFFKLS